MGATVIDGIRRGAQNTAALALPTGRTFPLFSLFCPTTHMPRHTCPNLPPPFSRGTAGFGAIFPPYDEATVIYRTTALRIVVIMIAANSVVPHCFGWSTSQISNNCKSK